LDMRRYLPLILFTGLALGQDFNQKGYLRNLEASICMSHCGAYYLEDELGYFLNYISDENDSLNLEYYLNRFVNIEGDSISCTECVSIDVIRIDISNDCELPVDCFSHPCSTSNCFSHPTAECIPNYCGGCWSDYYLDGELIECEVPEGCIDLTGIDFGECDMALGIGWVNNSCENISGCDWIIDSVDYTGAFFTSMDSCQQTCMVLNNDEDPLFPSSYYIYNNYPNPFNPITTLRYDIPKDSFVSITVYDMLGNVVNNLVNTNQSSGHKSVQWNATNNQGQPVSAGVYLYSIKAGEFRQTKKMILIK